MALPDVGVFDTSKRDGGTEVEKGKSPAVSSGLG